MLSYTNIRVHTSEKARFEGKPLGDAIVHSVHSLKIAARCAVFRAREGVYETGELSSDAVTDLSYNLPILIDIFVPASEADKLLETLKIMVRDGAVTVLPVEVVSFQSGRNLLPSHLKVKDVMTTKVIQGHPDFTVRTVVETLLDQNLESLPIVDDQGAPVGMVTQKDLARTSMPVRLGLLGNLSAEARTAYMKSVETIPVTKIMMTAPVVIGEDAKISDAVHLMVSRQKKRLPVVDRQGRMVGFLSRIDLLKAVASERTGDDRSEKTPSLPGSRTIRDIAKQDSEPLLAGTDLHTAIDTLVKRGDQRAAVVDQGGKLLGMVTDQDIVRVLGDAGFGQTIRRLFGLRKRHKVLISEVMQKEIVSITQDATTDQALKLMVDRGLKRLPVVDEDGCYQGMIRRDALLIALSHDL